MNTIKSCASLNSDCEVSIECNPNTTTEEKLKNYLQSGVNRISFGTQTFNDNLLKKIGRVHSSSQIINAVNLANKIGFNNISVDLMIGLPGQTIDDVKQDLIMLNNLPIKHFSCYSLILEDKTPLCNEVAQGVTILPNDDDVVEMYDFVTGFSKDFGFEKYEVSNFAKKGYECKHNLGYWKFYDYLGFGVAAHSYYDNFRAFNTSNLDEYINNDFDSIQTVEKIDLDESCEEYIMLSLRTKWGIDLIEFKKLFNKDLLLEKEKQINKLISYDLIYEKDNCLIVTEQGFHVLNKIILELI